MHNIAVQFTVEIEIHKYSFQKTANWKPKHPIEAKREGDLVKLRRSKGRIW